MREVHMLSDGNNHIECKKDNYAMNDIGYIGCKLDHETIDRHLNLRKKNVLSFIHEKSIKPNDRMYFYRIQDQICFCEKKEYPDGMIDWCCECENFVKHTVCAHTYYLKYGGVVSVDIPKKKGKTSKTQDEFKRTKVMEAYEKVDEMLKK